MTQNVLDKVLNEEMNEVADINKFKLVNSALLQILDRICKVSFASFFLNLIASLIIQCFVRSKNTR